MSVWQFFSALNGYIDANTPRERGKISGEAEADELFRWTEEGAPAAGQTFSTLVYRLPDVGEDGLIRLDGRSEWRV